MPTGYLGGQNLGDILTFLRGAGKGSREEARPPSGCAGCGDGCGGVCWGRGWCDGTAAGIRVREGEGCGGREVVGGWGYAGRGAAQLKFVQFYFSAVDGWVVGKWDGRGTGATEAAALGRRGALRNKALYNFIFPRTTTRQSGRGAPAQPVKKAAARDAQNGA